MFQDLKKYDSLLKGYTELRVQSNTNLAISLVKGNVTNNIKTSVSGVSARSRENGLWGFASNNRVNKDGIESAIRQANENALLLGSSLKGTSKEVEVFNHTIYKDFARNKKTGDFKISDEPRKRATQNDILEFMKEIDNYILKKYPNLANRIVRANCMDIEKTLLTSQGASSYLLMPRSVIYITMAMENNGDITELYDSFGGFGIFDDNFSTPDIWFDRIDRLYEDTRRKNEGIYAEGGIHECIIDSNLTGLMAHEAIGHTTEGDTVLKGSVARENVGNMVASELVTLRDYANNINGEICQVPVFIDDEGVTCKDANIIENGILKEFMHNRETAQKLGLENTGNARAWQYMDEPQVRMRNTVIMPGESKLEEMISSIEDGYYFGRCSNGQADSTSEFMFGAVLGYEIKNGKFGRALKDSTISGVAFEVLKTVSMVSDSFEWVPGATCWKKQMNIVGMGGPAIKCKVTVGGK